MKKIVLLILVIVFLIGCSVSRLYMPEKSIPFTRSDDESPVEFQAKMERIAKQQLEKGENVEIRYAGPLINTWYIKIYHYKEGKFQFADWKPKLSKDLQKSWKPKFAFITTYYKPCR